VITIHIYNDDEDIIRECNPTDGKKVAEALRFLQSEFMKARGISKNDPRLKGIFDDEIEEEEENQPTDSKKVAEALRQLQKSFEDARKKREENNDK